MMDLPRIHIADLLEPKPVNFTEKEFAEYLSTRRILIADKGAYSARALQRLLIQLGAKSSEIQVCRSFGEATRAIYAKKPHILITELYLGELNALELITVQEKQFANRLEIASLVMTSDPSSASVGMMTDANVDAVLLKPINFESSKAAIRQALAQKVKPTEYWSTIERGKEHLQRIELAEAMRQFEEARQFEPQSSLSHYYLGLVLRQQKDNDAAMKCFQEGLELNPNDYRCLSASFDLRFERFEYREAYALSKRMHQQYPVNARRLVDFVKLCVYVRKFDEIPDYYRVFTNLERAEGRTSRGMIAGMLVAAKALAWKGYAQKSLEALQHAARLAMKENTLHADVLRYFVETGNFYEGLNFYADLPDESKRLPEVELLHLETLHGSGSSHDVLQYGVPLIHGSHGTARLFEILIANSRRLRRPPAVVDRLVAEAETRFPRRDWRAVGEDAPLGNSL